MKNSNKIDVRETKIASTLSHKDTFTELPKGWVWAKVGDLGKVITGTTPNKSKPEYYSKDYPFFKPTDLNAGYYVKFSEDGLSDEGVKQARCLPEKSILVTCIGATIGKTGLIRVHGVSNQQINALVPADGILPEFVYFISISPDFQKSIVNNASATTLPILNKSKFELLQFPLPPFPEQRRIVAKIEELFARLDAGVEALRKVKAEIKRYRQTVLKHAFEGKLTEEWRAAHKGEFEPASVLLERIKEERKKNEKGKYKELPSVDKSELSSLPDGWAWTRLGLIADDVKTVDPKNAPKKEFIYLDIASIDNKKQKIVSPKKYYGKDAPSRARQLVKSGDTLFSTVRTYLKNIAIVDAIYDSQIASTGFCVIRPHSQAAESRFIFYLTNTESFLNPLTQLQRGTSYPAVRDSDVLGQFIPLPPLPEQYKIVEEIERHFSIADGVEASVDQSLKQAERLRQSILKRAFEGKLVPQDSSDESAEKLLARIKAEKVKQEMNKKTCKKSSKEKGLR